MSSPKIWLAVSTAASIIYVTILVSRSITTSATLIAVLGVLLSAVVITAAWSMHAHLTKRLDEIRAELHDYGDRREVTGYQVASRAYQRHLHSVE